MASTNQWRPIVDGELAEEVFKSVRSIAESLRNPPEIWHPPEFPDHLRAASRHSLGKGHAGLALFHAYLGRAYPETGGLARAPELIDGACDGVAEGLMSPGLYAGFTGVAWVLEHLQKFLPALGEEDLNQDIESALMEHLRLVRSRSGFDLISGLVGFGLLALERVPRPGAVELLEMIVVLLEESAHRLPEGVAWWSPIGTLALIVEDPDSDGYYDLGVAHGIAGIIALLSGAIQADVARAQARALLDRSVAWLLAHRNPEGSRALFPAWVGAAAGQGGPRPSWCRGDLGIATALFLAARSTGESDLELVALEIARLAARRAAVEQFGDACICHGTAGVAHMLNRLYHSTGCAELGAAANLWIRHTLSQRSQRGVAGYLSIQGDRKGGRYVVDDAGFLNGAAGVGLVLLAAVAPVEPSWDRVLCLSQRDMKPAGSN